MIKIRKIKRKENVYDINVDKVHNFYANGILVHNCCEITLPTEGASFKDEVLDYQGNIVQTYSSDEKIALCNLASINLERYNYMEDSEKKKLFYDVVRNLDNSIDVAYYPVKAAEIPNKKNRYLGIGVSNLANYLALNKLSIDDRASLDVQAELFDEISYGLIEASIQLAKEKGRAEGFNHTKYAEGLYPYKIGNEKAKSLISYKPDEKKWDKLMNEAMKFGMRNCTLMAIAPTACTTVKTSIQTENGVKSYEDILKEQDIDFEYIQEINAIGWYNFKNPFNVYTRDGLKEVNRIWYNGKQPTRIITLEDGNEYEFTLNHQLLVKTESGEEKWICVSDLKEGMDIVSI